MIDARSGAALGQVRVSSARINHLTLLLDGSVMVLDKAGDYPNVTVDFHIDALTGEFSSASADVHSGVSVPIHADALTKITVHDAGSQPGHVESRPAEYAPPPQNTYQSQLLTRKLCDVFAIKLHY